MATRLIELEDGILVEAEVSEEEAQPISTSVVKFDLNAPNGHLPCGSLSGILAMVSPSVYPVGLNYGGWIYKGTITPQPPMGGVPADASSSSETGCVDIVGCFGTLFSRKDL